MAKTRQMIGVYFGSDKKKNWVGSANNGRMAKALIKSHADATNREVSDYKTFNYMDDPDKLSGPF